MDYKPFADAVGAANNVQAPSTPYPELAAMMRSSFQLPLAQGGMEGIAGMSSVKRQQDDAAAAKAQAEKIAMLKEEAAKAKDMLDPKKYQQVRKDDGGYAFYAPDGSPVSVGDYARITGKSFKDVLKDSENNIDQQYLQDYKSMQELANAFANGDKKYLDALPNEMKDYMKGKTMADIMKDFKSQYSGLYGTGVGLGNGQGQLRTPDQAQGDTYPVFHDMAQRNAPVPDAQPNFLQETLKRLFGVGSVTQQKQGTPGKSPLTTFGSYRGF